MNDAPVTSVLIVAFDSGPFLPACVGAVLASDEALEVLVADNASGDDSIAALASEHGRDPRLRIRRYRSNLGFARAVNSLLPHARGRHVALLNPDCLVGRSTLRRLREALEATPGAGVAGGLVLGADGAMQKGCRRRLPEPRAALVRATGLSRTRLARRVPDFDLWREPLPAHTEDREAVSGSFMMIRRELLERLGGLDGGYFMHCEDLDLCARVREAGERVLFVPCVAVAHWKGASSRARPVRVSLSLHRGMLRFYRRHFLHRYPRPLSWAVTVSVWTRFAVLAAAAPLRRLAAAGQVPGPAALAQLRGVAERLDAIGQPAPRTLVVGGTSHVARYLLPSLMGEGRELVVLARGLPAFRRVADVTWLGTDVTRALPRCHLEGAQSLVHLAPIWLLPEYLPQAAAAGVRRIVAVSSTSVLTKADAANAHDRALARRLAEGESRAREQAAERGIALTILRPTLVYGGGMDRNIVPIARWIRRFRVFPLVGDGSGLRQPVHAADVARACEAALALPCGGRTFVLSGARPLTYRDMVREVYRALGRRPRIVSVPLPVFRVLIRCARLLPRYRWLTPDMADRMQKHMAFDHAAAAEVLGFRPRPFQPEVTLRPPRELPGESAARTVPAR